MQPLIQSFTKNLSGCSGCGNSALDYFNQKDKGEPVKFILQIEAEGDDLIKAITSDRSAWNVISGNPARQTPQATAGVIQGSQFSRTTTSSTPQIQAQ